MVNDGNLIPEIDEIISDAIPGEEEIAPDAEESPLKASKKKPSAKKNSSPNTSPNRSKVRLISSMILLLSGSALAGLAGVVAPGAHIVTVDAAKADPDHNGDLVYVHGPLNSKPLSDPIFNIAIDGLQLDRIVEMYQLPKDTAAKDGKPVEPLWAEEVLDPEGSGKNLTMYLTSEHWKVDEVMLGGFSLSTGLSQQLGTPQERPVTEEDWSKLNAHGQQAFKIYEGMLYFSLDPAHPQPGDLRVHFKTLSADQVSVLAMQQGNQLQAYRNDDQVIERLRPGTIKPEVLIGNASVGGGIMLWGLRGLGIVLALSGLGMLALRRSAPTPGTVRKPTRHTGKGKAKTLADETIGLHDLEIEDESFMSHVHESTGGPALHPELAASVKASNQLSQTRADHAAAGMNEMRQVVHTDEHDTGHIFDIPHLPPATSTAPIAPVEPVLPHGKTPFKTLEFTPYSPITNTPNSPPQAPTPVTMPGLDFDMDWQPAASAPAPAQPPYQPQPEAAFAAMDDNNLDYFSDAPPAMPSGAATPPPAFQGLEYTPSELPPVGQATTQEIAKIEELSFQPEQYDFPPQTAPIAPHSQPMYTDLPQAAGGEVLAFGAIGGVTTVPPSTPTPDNSYVAPHFATDTQPTALPPTDFDFQAPLEFDTGGDPFDFPSQVEIVGPDTLVERPIASSTDTMPYTIPADGSRPHIPPTPAVATPPFYAEVHDVEPVGADQWPAPDPVFAPLDRPLREGSVPNLQTTMPDAGSALPPEPYTVPPSLSAPESPLQPVEPLSLDTSFGVGMPQLQSATNFGVVPPVFNQPATFHAPLQQEAYSPQSSPVFAPPPRNTDDLGALGIDVPELDDSGFPPPVFEESAHVDIPELQGQSSAFYNDSGAEPFTPQPVFAQEISPQNDYMWEQPDYPPQVSPRASGLSGILAEGIQASETADSETFADSSPYQTAVQQPYNAPFDMAAPSFDVAPPLEEPLDSAWDEPTENQNNEDEAGAFAFDPAPMPDSDLPPLVAAPQPLPPAPSFAVPPPAPPKPAAPAMPAYTPPPPLPPVPPVVPAAAAIPVPPPMPRPAPIPAPAPMPVMPAAPTYPPAPSLPPVPPVIPAAAVIPVMPAVPAYAAPPPLPPLPPVLPAAATMPVLPAVPSIPIPPAIPAAPAVPPPPAMSTPSVTPPAAIVKSALIETPEEEPMIMPWDAPDAGMFEKGGRPPHLPFILSDLDRLIAETNSPHNVFPDVEPE